MPKEPIFLSEDLERSPAIRRVRMRLGQVAPGEMPVVFQGETGVGKTAWVRAWSVSTGRQPLVEIGCADTPATLLEAEWFGAVKGSFTGAERDRMGSWEQAGSGMICLDRIDLLPVEIQPRLLRVLENRRFSPLGGKERSLRARLVATSARPLVELVREGLLRQDLLYRLGVWEIEIPPLRERQGEILHWMAYWAEAQGITLDLGAAGRDVLCRYTWPGNLRELRICFDMLALGGGVIDDATILKWMAERVWTDPVARGLEERWTLAEMDRRYVLAVLERCQGNRSRAARMLGISRKTLYSWLKSWEEA